MHMEFDAKIIGTLGRLADHVLAAGIAGSSLRQLAAAADTSDRMLLYYFRDKAELMTATLAVVASRLTAILDAGAAEPASLAIVQARLAPLIADPELWPYQRLFLEIASLAANGDTYYRGVGEQLGRGFLAWSSAQIDAIDPAERARDAARLLLMIEGAVFLRAIGLDDVTEAALHPD
jgi:AcrR family transcriptional regulator